MFSGTILKGRDFFLTNQHFHFFSSHFGGESSIFKTQFFFFKLQIHSPPNKHPSHNFHLKKHFNSTASQIHLLKSNKPLNFFEECQRKFINESHSLPQEVNKITKDITVHKSLTKLQAKYV